MSLFIVAFMVITAVGMFFWLMMRPTADEEGSAFPRGTCTINSSGAARTLGSPITNGPAGFVRRHVVRSAAREGSEHGPYRKSRLIPLTRWRPRFE
jgi:hypothetical protein